MPRLSKLEISVEVFADEFAPVVLANALHHVRDAMIAGVGKQTL